MIQAMPAEAGILTVRYRKGVIRLRCRLTEFCFRRAQCNRKQHNKINSRILMNIFGKMNLTT